MTQTDGNTRTVQASFNFSATQWYGVGVAANALIRLTEELMDGNIPAARITLQQLETQMDLLSAFDTLAGDLELLKPAATVRSLARNLATVKFYPIVEMMRAVRACLSAARLLTSAHSDIERQALAKIGGGSQQQWNLGGVSLGATLHRWGDTGPLSFAAPQDPVISSPAAAPSAAVSPPAAPAVSPPAPPPDKPTATVPKPQGDKLLKRRALKGGAGGGRVKPRTDPAKR